MSGRKDFLSQQAPENYVAGLGRGATGFTTRSDLGPAREGPSEDQIKEALAKRAAQLGAPTPSAYGAVEKKEEEDDDERFQDPENEVGLFATGAYDRDDDEADRIYQDIDERMDRRRKARREAREKQEREEYEAKNPKIQQQFADLKRSLGSVSDEQWQNIPEVGDLTGKNRRAKQNLRQRFYAVPDSVIAGARNSTEFDTSVNDGAQTNGSSADNVDGTMTNFADIGAARDKVLQVNLDKAAMGSADANSGSASTIDPKGYLTSLSKTELRSQGYDIGDVKRVESLLQSVIKTNSRHPPGYIALARLHELAGKPVKARDVMAQCCSLNPHSEDAWLENIRLNEGHNAKVIAAASVKENPQSTRLWTRATELETDPQSKKRVLRRALDLLPKSVVLWKQLVQLSQDEGEARLLLAKACSEITASIELHLALARIVETVDEARKVLNTCRRANPKNAEVWIAASRLEEQVGSKNTANIMKRAVQSLANENAMLTREEWIEQAEKCEEEGAILTGQNIIRETLSYGLDEDDDRKKLFMEDAQASISRGRYETARAIYAYILRLWPTSKSAWEASANLEKVHGKKEDLWNVLSKAVEAVPQADDLWIQYANEKYLSGDVDGARIVLGKAFNQSPSENIYLEAINLEARNGQIDQARDLLAQARQEAGTDRVWIKSVHFARTHDNNETALDLVTQALQLYPSQWKLWAQKGQIYSAQHLIPQAREAYATGTRACPKAVPLWILLSQLEETQAGSVVKARSVLDRARAANPKNERLWLESVRLERRAGNLSAAKNLMARALQPTECQKSGPLWAERIWHLEPRTQRKPLSLEAVKVVESDPTLFTTVARVFWAERKLEKAATWFEKAVLVDADWGDTWAWYWKFLLMHGTEEKRGDVLEKLRLAEPRHGEVWAGCRKEVGREGWGVERVLEEVVRVLE
ncbi:MAG: hypothetical protein LQ338_004767 [Usnochroma carphineum]|nr:MAG: hypothetical protein LQ338_004767 [Usnochroma carphineum]